MIFPRKIFFPNLGRGQLPPAPVSYAYGSKCILCARMTCSQSLTFSLCLLFLRPPMCRRHYDFGLSVCPFVRPCVQACVWKSLLAWYLTNQSTEFHQTLADDVLEAKDGLVRFSRSSERSRTKSLQCQIRKKTSAYPYLLNSMKYHNLIEHDMDTPYSRDEGHKVPRARSDQGHVKFVTTISRTSWRILGQNLYKSSMPQLDELITWVKIKVAARSNIWTSYCGRQRHPHRRLGVELSSSQIWATQVWYSSIQEFRLHPGVLTQWRLLG